MAGNYDGCFITGGSAMIFRSTSAITPLSREEDRRSEVGLPGECFYLGIFFSCPLYMFSSRGSYRALTNATSFHTHLFRGLVNGTYLLFERNRAVASPSKAYPRFMQHDTDIVGHAHSLASTVFRDLGQGKITFSLETTLVCFVVSACAS